MLFPNYNSLILVIKVVLEKRMNKKTNTNNISFINHKKTHGHHKMHPQNYQNIFLKRWKKALNDDKTTIETFLF